MLIVGIDPGFTGAWGMIDHHGEYWSCGDMHNNKHHIDTRAIYAEMLQARDRQDCEVVIESVHAMPNQGVSSTFKFGMAFGAALALAERFGTTVHLVSPRQWKKSLKLDSDKDKSLELARQLWPNAPLQRKKDNGRAEALLMAYWWKKENE